MPSLTHIISRPSKDVEFYRFVSIPSVEDNSISYQEKTKQFTEGFIAAHPGTTSNESVSEDGLTLTIAMTFPTADVLTEFYHAQWEPFKQDIAWRREYNQKHGHVHTMKIDLA